MGHGILLEVKLTALAGDSRQTGGQAGVQTGMIIPDDELDAVEASLLQAGQKVAPMHFGFTEFGADAQDRTFALMVNTQGHEDGAGAHGASQAHFLIAGVQNQEFKPAQGTEAPEGQFLIQFSGDANWSSEGRRRRSPPPPINGARASRVVKEIADPRPFE